MEEAESEGTTKEEEEAKGEQQKPSLFPIFPLSSGPSVPQTTPSDESQWLSNPSFTPSLSSIPGPSTSQYNPILNDSDGSDADEIPPSKPRTYEPLDSSPSDQDSDRDKRGPSKKKTKKRRKRKRSRERVDDPSRRSGVRTWAGLDVKAEKDYYFDSRGDRDNLAFGCLYRMDVARYKLYSPMNFSRVCLQVLYHRKQSSPGLDIDGDIDALDYKLREGGRYFSTKYSILERRKDFKHVRILAGQKYATHPGEFIPLIELQTSHERGNSELLAEAEIVESWEDEMLRRTKEFNRMSRETPHDEKVWLSFAEFQDKVASLQPQKAARLQTLEKKISILEKAVELNLDSEDLLLCLMKAYQSRDSNEVLIGRWEKILKQHSASCKLWKEFLHFCQGEFSRFKVSEMRKIYAYAIQALSAACIKLCRQVHQNGQQQSADPAFVQLELGLVDAFISLCRFEWQAGYQEVATGLFQAELEYSLFCPSLLLTEQSKQRLFEHFWNSSCARIGEDAALGWSAWLEKEEENRQKVNMEDTSQENEVGGWTGWLEPLSKQNENNKEPEKLVDVNTDEDIGEDFESKNMKHEEDEVESLLKKLGINVDAEADSEINDPSIWNRWSEEESLRDCEQWMPVRDNSGGEGDEQLSRVILFEDVSEYLFSLRTEEARFFLVSQFVDFFGGKISQRLSTNSPSWTENTLGLETLPYSILEGLSKVDEAVTGRDSGMSHFNLEFLLGHSNDLSRETNIMKFLRNAILLCLSIFPRNYILEEAVLAAEELFTTQMKSCACSVTPSRALAKLLLKNDRQDLLLCGVYARSEAAFGNVDLARRIFDMALSSIEGLPLDLQGNAPLLYFWYAEMELATCSSSSNLEPSSPRSIHILSCLGSGVSYTPFKCSASSLQLLRARQGFKEQIKKLRSAWMRGDVKDQSIALICSAALFEDLTIGMGAGMAVFEEAFSMTLPERRSQNSHLEYLFNHYVRMLQKHLQHSKPSKAWKAILQGLQIYPYNPTIFAAFVEIGCLCTVPYKLRQIFDEYCKKKPSVIVWLFALSFELGKAGSQHRIHSLFERALASDQLQKSVIMWRCYLAYEVHIAHNPSAARRIFFRAIHACPWSKKLWLDGFLKLHNVLTAKELSDLQEVMRDKELHLRTDIYEILLQEDT